MRKVWTLNHKHNHILYSHGRFSTFKLNNWKKVHCLSLLFRLSFAYDFLHAINMVNAKRMFYVLFIYLCLQVNRYIMNPKNRNNQSKTRYCVSKKNNFALSSHSIPKKEKMYLTKTISCCKLFFFLYFLVV